MSGTAHSFAVSSFGKTVGILAIKTRLKAEEVIHNVENAKETSAEHNDGEWPGSYRRFIRREGAPPTLPRLSDPVHPRRWRAGAGPSVCMLNCFSAKFLS